MKFGKSLSNQIDETLPEWRDKFLSYKGLKKKLKLIEPKRPSSSAGEEGRAKKKQKVDSELADGREAMTEAEANFVKLLEDELEKFNAFFVEKEEECIIRLKELQDRVAKADKNEEMIKIRKEIVDLHGEMVLLENYSALNYTGLAKILKKYDKRTGALLRLPFIQKVVQQPFFTTDLLYKLVNECERMLDCLFPVNKPPTENDAADGQEPSTSSTANNEVLLKGPNELAEIKFMESLYMKSTISALRVLKEIRSGSSTVSVFSLPPLQLGGLEDAWNKVPAVGQVAE
ncbi:SPX domain-containing 1-like [Olea europaea subsp. europaea]|uniref:SPX domain-containing 1-like n=1 Tax=Olea europaea subsp. europaea TaxID=158383 RepID=A0A8S0V0J2_OLEEU|nr:SPX domain-containing 1-like [Olea europaea subsp. europaea]